MHLNNMQARGCTTCTYSTPFKLSMCMHMQMLASYLVGGPTITTLSFVGDCVGHHLHAVVINFSLKWVYSYKIQTYDQLGSINLIVIKITEDVIQQYHLHYRRDKLNSQFIITKFSVLHAGGRSLFTFQTSRES